jgi:ketohexokinase
LSDILAHAPTENKSPAPKPTTKLHLISVLPDEESQDTAYIRDSIPDVRIAGIFRKGHHHAASSMIIQSKRNDTRTIVSHGSDLPEMTCEEFIKKFHSTAPVSGEKVWVHFEGRIPEVTNQCVRELRNVDDKEIMISVECEKPDRKGLDDAAELAEVVFYSKLWAEVCPLFMKILAMVCLRGIGALQRA